MTEYNEGPETFICDGKALVSGELLHRDGHKFPDWFTELGNHFGEKCKVVPLDEEFTLEGLSYTDVDYYYILKDKDGRKHLSSCVGKIEFLG